MFYLGLVLAVLVYSVALATFHFFGCDAGASDPLRHAQQPDHAEVLYRDRRCGRTSQATSRGRA